jgi:hypothetical protein
VVPGELRLHYEGLRTEPRGQVEAIITVDSTRL